MEMPTAITVIADIHSVTHSVSWLYRRCKDDDNSFLGTRIVSMKGIDYGY